MMLRRPRRISSPSSIVKKRNTSVLPQLIPVFQCVNISADMAYNREMDALKDSKSQPDGPFVFSWWTIIVDFNTVKDPPYLSLMRLNRALVVIQVSWRFPLISPLKYIYLLSIMMGHSHVREHSRQQLERRIRHQGAVEHLDFIEQLIPTNREPPKGKELRHLEQVAGQLLLAGYEPPSLWFYFTVYHLVQTQSALAVLTQEIRNSFKSYDAITASSAANLPYLTACLKESLRFTPPLLTGMPVISPGATVDGTYVPKGVRHPRILVHFLSQQYLTSCHNYVRSFANPVLSRWHAAHATSVSPHSSGQSVGSLRKIAIRSLIHNLPTTT